MPKSIQPKAKAMLHDIWMAETRNDAEQAFDLFVDSFQAKYEKAVDCLQRCVLARGCHGRLFTPY